MANRYPAPQPPPGYFVEILIDQNNNQEAVIRPDHPLPEETFESESEESDIPDEEFVTWDMAQVTGEFDLAWDHFVRRHRVREAREAREAQQAQENQAASFEDSARQEFGLTEREHGNDDSEHEQEEHDLEADGHPEDDKEGDTSVGEKNEVEVKGEPSKHST